MSRDGKSEKVATGETVKRRRGRVAMAALLAAALPATAVLAVRARSWPSPPMAATEMVKGKAAKIDVSDDPPPLPADVTLTTLNSSGFTPSEIAHEAGRFRVVVQNKSGETRLDLRLDGEGSSRWAERHALGEVQGWVAEVELAAGAYTITDSHHPGWVCRLIVQ